MDSTNNWGYSKLTFLSYAQNFEDVMLWRALRDVKHGFYIDIGAAWPSEDSVTKAFYDRGWRGVNIEPNPSLHHRLCLERPDDINLQLAVSNNPGILQLSLISGTGLSTLQSTIADKHIQRGYAVEHIEVQTQTLHDICVSLNLQNQPIHFLKVDVEGHEESVLLSQNWELFRPWIVVVEATLPMSQLQSYETWEASLLNVNYTFAYADGLNRFYVANEQMELLGAFSYPPNVFDEFIQANQEKVASILVERAESSVASAIQQNNELQLQLTQSLNEQSTLHSRNLALFRQIEEQDAQLKAIRNTLSWRMTAPFRFLKLQLYCLKRDGFRSRLIALIRKYKRRFINPRSTSRQLDLANMVKGVNGVSQAESCIKTMNRVDRIYKKLCLIYGPK